MDLSVKIGDTIYKSPVFLASGTAGFGQEFARVIDLSSIGGVITKTITSMPREGNPPPRLWETPAGMLNSIGLANPGIDAFINDIAPKLADLPTDIIVSVGGTSINDFVNLVEKVSAIDFIPAIELNLSCPNVRRGGMHFGRDTAVVSELFAKLRPLTEKNLWAKLSPQVTDIAELAMVAQQSGADAVVVMNTLPAMAIDIETKKPRLGAITGGLSGPAIHPVAVALVHSLRSKIDIPIIGVGGISSGEDAVELMLAGACAVQVGSGTFANANLPTQINKFIADYINRQGYSSAAEIVGTVKI